MAKLLFLFFSFLFSLLHRKECRKVSHYKCHMVMSHDKSHDRCGKVVHRPCSSCIYSVENQMGTLSSSPCQLRLGVDLSHLG